MLGDAGFCYSPSPSALPLRLRLQALVHAAFSTNSNQQNSLFCLSTDDEQPNSSRIRIRNRSQNEIESRERPAHPIADSEALVFSLIVRSSYRVRLLLAALVCLCETIFAGSFTMTGASSSFGTFCTVLLLLSSASLVQRADAQEEYIEKTCVEVYGDNTTNWPDWLSVCHNNGTCMLYYPYEGDPFPFPYCICDPPYTGMACETIDWGSDSAMMASTYAGASAAVFFGIFAIVTAIVFCCYFSSSYRKKVRKRRAEKLGHKDGKPIETDLYNLKGGTFQLDTKSAAQTPTTGTTTINGISDLDENGNDRRHSGNGDLPTVDEVLINKRSRPSESATPQRSMPNRFASIRASRIIRDSDTIKFIDEEETDEVDCAGNPVFRRLDSIATSLV